MCKPDGFFRSVLDTSIDRVSDIDIDRFGFEKAIWDGKGQSSGAQAKHCSRPENRDALISYGKHRASATTLSIGFEHLYRVIDIDQSSVGKSNWDGRGEIVAAPAKHLFGPRNSRCVDFFPQT